MHTLIHTDRRTHMPSVLQMSLRCGSSLQKGHCARCDPRVKFGGVGSRAASLVFIQPAVVYYPLPVSSGFSFCSR